MSKFLLLIFTCMFAASCFAATIATDGLTEKQINQIRIQALQLQNQEKKTEDQGALDTVTKVSEVTRGEAEKWSSLGKNLGSALIATAKELGVAANEFSQTSLGRVATAIIVYKLIGRDIIHFFVGLIMMFGLPTLIIFARRYVCVKDVTYAYVDSKFLFFPYKKKTVQTLEKASSDTLFWSFFWSIAFTGVAIAASLLVMFI